MAGFTVDQPVHFQAGGPGTAMVGANTRVKGQLGFVGTALDALTFANGTGAWTVPNTRTRAGGAFLVSQSSVGQAALSVAPFTAPILVVSGDTKIRSL